jgi:hypothetical protein
VLLIGAARDRRTLEMLAPASLLPPLEPLIEDARQLPQHGDATTAAAARQIHTAYFTITQTSSSNSRKPECLTIPPWPGAHILPTLPTELHV